MSSILPKVRSDFFGYTHSFDPYFNLNGERHNKEKLIREFGILSPREARNLGVPYAVNIRIALEGVADYDDVIFLFPIRERSIIPKGPGTLTAILDCNIPILTPEEMSKRYNGAWVPLSNLYGGEVYAFTRIQPMHIVDIIRL